MRLIRSCTGSSTCGSLNAGKAFGFILLVTLAAASCGRRTNTENGPSLAPGAACINNDECQSGICQTNGTCALLPDGEACADPSECSGGLCTGGICGGGGGSGPTGPTGPSGGTSCSDDSDCTPPNYCHFPSGLGASVQGTCDAPCTGDNDCDIGQACLDFQYGPATSDVRKECYTQNDCTPGNGSTDCPPGEVCNSQSRSCTAPPANCYFNEQCPAGWVCNVDHHCIDPNNVDLGDCTAPADCNGISACAGGSCTCEDGDCVPSGCGPSSPCPQGSYCAAGACQPATACPQGQPECSPYGLVCVSGYCTNPQPCGSGNTCSQGGYTCQTNLNPPACMPPGSGCTRDDQCSAGRYCNVFAGSCELGCRNSAECAGQCSGQTPCNCDGTHQCSTNGGGGGGQSCTDDSQCGAGLVCSYTNPDPLQEFTCGAIPIGDCAKTCHQACDLFTGLIDPTAGCPQGTSCGGGATGDPMFLLLKLLLPLLLGQDVENPGASACY